MAHSLISRLLVVALLFQALAAVPVAFASCPASHAVQTASEHCAGDGDDASHPACPCCLAGISNGACAGACAAPALPVDTAASIAPPEHWVIASVAAPNLHDQRYAPPDPPPIR